MLSAQNDIKDKLKDIFKAKYLKNEELTELAIAKSDLNYLLAILTEYGSFSNFEKELGYLQRHSREREKFKLYLIFKSRFRDFGPEAFRPKNVENDLLQETIKAFGSLSALTKKILLNLSPDTLLFEAHIYFLGGGTIEAIHKERPNLYKSILNMFSNLISFSQEYQKRFLLNPLKDFREASADSYNIYTGLSAENETELELASQITVEELIDFIILNNLSDESLLHIKKKFPIEYIAIEKNGGLDEILENPLFTKSYTYFAS